MRGTPFYWPPEIIISIWFNWYTQLNGKFNPIKVDMYCLGLIALELLLGSKEINQLTLNR